MKVLVLGANGQLGTDLRQTNPGHTLFAHTRDDADVTDAAAIDRFITDVSPDVVINTVADNRTEAAEGDPAPAFAVNALGARNVARAAGARARVMHLSTDFVFDGTKDAPYVESDPPRPINAYGVSKLAGEMLVAQASSRHWVVRTASLYGHAGSRAKGGHFVQKILTAARAQKPLSVVDNIRMSPTCTGDLAAALWVMIDRDVPGGVYHVANAGDCSWREFAEAVLADSGIAAPVAASRYAPEPGKMPRPLRTTLASEKLGSLGLPPMAPWRDALRRFLHAESARL